MSLRKVLLVLLVAWTALAAHAREDSVAMDPAYDAAFDRGDYAEAERLALKFFQALPAKHDYGQESHIGGVRMLAEVRGWQARFAEAEKLGGFTSGSEADSKARYDFVDRLYGEGLHILRGFYGPDHPTHALKAHKYATWIQNHNRDLAQASALLRGALAAYRKHYGDLDGATQELWEEVFVLELRRNRYAEANAEIAALLPQYEKDPKAYALVVAFLGLQAGALTLMDRQDDALRAMQRQVRIAQENADTWLWRRKQEQLVNAYEARGMKGEAEEARRVLACLRRTPNEQKPDCR